MKTTEYLYGIEASKLIDMNYKEALEYKLKSAKQLISSLHKIEMGHRDEKRIDNVFDAIDFNDKLLRELKC